ncbi:MAG TPA: hypothetical protein VMD27_03425 [Candidatus Aquilonibacter sp.]|nr:hypothetical protein [Candidatus Aquilonibacter sp.]
MARNVSQSTAFFTSIAGESFEGDVSDFLSEETQPADAINAAMAKKENAR